MCISVLSGIANSAIFQRSRHNHVAFLQTSVAARTGYPFEPALTHSQNCDALGLGDAVWDITASFGAWLPQAISKLWNYQRLEMAFGSSSRPVLKQRPKASVESHHSTTLMLLRNKDCGCAPAHENQQDRRLTQQHIDQCSALGFWRMIAKEPSWMSNALWIWCQKRQEAMQKLTGIFAGCAEPGLPQHCQSGLEHCQSGPSEPEAGGAAGQSCSRGPSAAGQFHARADVPTALGILCPAALCRGPVDCCGPQGPA